MRMKMTWNPEISVVCYGVEIVFSPYYSYVPSCSTACVIDLATLYYVPWIWSLDLFLTFYASLAYAFVLCISSVNWSFKCFNCWIIPTFCSRKMSLLHSVSFMLSESMPFEVMPDCEDLSSFVAMMGQYVLVLF